MRTQGTPLTIHFHCQNAREMAKFKLQKKVTNINLRIISKPHAYLQSMVIISVKFQENRNKTVGGVAHTRYMHGLFLGEIVRDLLIFWPEISLKLVEWEKKISQQNILTNKGLELPPVYNSLLLSCNRARSCDSHH